MHQPPIAARILFPLLLIGLLWLAWQQRDLFRGGPTGDPTRLILTGTVEATRISLASRVGGRIATHEAPEGSAVTANQLLVTLTNAQLLAQAPVLRAQRAQAEATWADLVDGTRPEEIAQARAALRASQERLALLEAGTRPEESAQAASTVDLAQAVQLQAEKEAQRARRLFDNGVIARQELEAAELRLTQTTEQLKQAQEQAALVAAGPRSQELAIARAQIAQQQAGIDLLEAGATPQTLERAEQVVEAIKAQEAALQTELTELAITAPRAGVIDRYLVDPGEVVAPGQAIVTLRDPLDIRLRAWLPEPALGQVRLGQLAEIRIEGRDTLKATVLSIASDAEFTPRNIQTPEERATQVFAMDLRITDPPDWLRDGMTLEVILDRQTS